MATAPATAGEPDEALSFSSLLRHRLLRGKENRKVRGEWI
jgi:hypothetical protein